MKIYRIAEEMVDDILTEREKEIQNENPDQHPSVLEYKADWLKRHTSQYFKNNSWTFYHGTPRKNLKIMRDIRKGSLLTDNINSAVHYAGRDRDLDEGKIVVFELRLEPREFNAGIFPSLAQDILLDSPNVRLVKG